MSIARESWHLEADDQKRLRQLLNEVRSRRTVPSEVTAELAKLIHRLGLKEIPAMPEYFRKVVFMHLHPGIQGYLQGLVREITGHTYFEMFPYWRIHDTLKEHALKILGMIGSAAWEWQVYQVVSLRLLDEIEAEMQDWQAVVSQKLPPAPKMPGISESRPFISLGDLGEEELPSWLARVFPDEEGSS